MGREECIFIAYCPLETLLISPFWKQWLILSRGYSILDVVQARRLHCTVLLRFLRMKWIWRRSMSFTCGILKGYMSAGV
jgi:hypothetical protein